MYMYHTRRKKPMSVTSIARSEVIQRLIAFIKAAPNELVSQMYAKGQLSGLDVSRLQALKGRKLG